MAVLGKCSLIGRVSDCGSDGCRFKSYHLPMWNFLIKKKINTNWFNFTPKKILKKLNLYISDIKINKILFSHSFLTYLYSSLIKINHISILNIYIECIKIFRNIDYNVYKYSLVFKLKKKQLYSFINKNGKIIFQISNGCILRKLNVTKKSSKKEIKISLANIKTIADHKFIKFQQNIIIIINGLRSNSHKIINNLKKYFHKNHLLIIKPVISFSNFRFKKIKSIKRKLKKKYTNINN